MKSANILFLIGCCILLIASCASRPDNTLIGKWATDDNTRYVEFFPDGTLYGGYAADDKSKRSGKYTLVDANTIRMQIDGEKAYTFTMQVIGDELILSNKELSADSSRLRRVEKSF